MNKVHRCALLPKLKRYVKNLTEHVLFDQKTKKNTSSFIKGKEELIRKYNKICSKIKNIIKAKTTLL